MLIEGTCIKLYRDGHGGCLRNACPPLVVRQGMRRFGYRYVKATAILYSEWRKNTKIVRYEAHTLHMHFEVTFAQMETTLDTQGRSAKRTLGPDLRLLLGGGLPTYAWLTSSSPSAPARTTARTRLLGDGVAFSLPGPARARSPGGDENRADDPARLGELIPGMRRTRRGSPNTPVLALTNGAGGGMGPSYSGRYARSSVGAWAGRSGRNVGFWGNVRSWIGARVLGSVWAYRDEVAHRAVFCEVWELAAVVAQTAFQVVAAFDHRLLRCAPDGKRFD